MVKTLLKWTHWFTIIMVAVVAVWPSLSSLVDLDPYVVRGRLIVYWFDNGTAPMSLLLLIFYNLIYYYYYFKSRLPIIPIQIFLSLLLFIEIFLCLLNQSIVQSIPMIEFHSIHNNDDDDTIIVINYFKLLSFVLCVNRKKIKGKG